MPRALPSSGTTIKTWILEQFHRSQSELIRKLSRSRSRIHFTFDMWTSPNHRAFFGVVAHWMDQTLRLHSTVLGMRRFKGRHTGENQAKHFWDIIKTYQITANIGYFTLDNASNNDTALKYIAKHLQELGLEFNPTQRRLRCFGHIINLTVKALLWGINADAFELEINSHRELQHETEELEAWRQKGPLGKLHNIITWISRSPQRRDRFEEKVLQALGPNTKALALIHGNTTRWGGDYNSLTRAFDLREPLEDFVAAAIRRNEDGEYDGLPSSLQHDELTIGDWDTLRDIMDILEPFHRWQLKLQKKEHFGQLHDIFPAMDELLGQLEESKQLYESISRRHNTQHIRTSINAAWLVLNK